MVKLFEKTIFVTNLNDMGYIIKLYRETFNN